VALYRRGRPGLAVGLGTGTVLAAVPFLIGYYTTMHGDRPRWAEAAGYLRRAADVRPQRSDNPAIYATVPGVVARYLGVPADQTMGHPLVRDLPPQPPEGASEQWFVVEVGVLTPAYRAWLEGRCDLLASFVARSGPKDRTVNVYRTRDRSGTTGRSRFIVSRRAGIPFRLGEP
jgi:hypothetical protein